MSSEAEAEVGSLFYNSKSGEPIRVTLDEMVHPQQATPMNIDNWDVEGKANNTIQKSIIKSIDIWFYWVKDRILQGHNNMFWKPEATNLANYFTKHHPPQRHLQICAVYLHWPGNASHANTRVCYSNYNTILKEILKQDTNNEAHLQIRIIETYREMDRRTNGLSGGGGGELNLLRGGTNHPPLINLNREWIIWQCWTNRYIVVSPSFNSEELSSLLGLF